MACIYEWQSISIEGKKERGVVEREQGRKEVGKMGRMKGGRDGGREGGRKEGRREGRKGKIQTQMKQKLKFRAAPVSSPELKNRELFVEFVSENEDTESNF